MATIQWRPEVNALTTPQSYWIRFVPRSVVDSEELAKRMTKAQPNYSEEEFRAFLTLRNEIIQDALANGEQVKLSGFGNFDLRDKNQRPGRNPKTGEEIPITARRVVTFRPGQKLKARVEAYAGTGE